jgi:hypothetical protein
MAESMKGRERLTDLAETMVPTWTTRPREGKTYLMRLSGGPSAAGATASAIELRIESHPPPGPEKLARRRAAWRELHARGASLFLPMTTLRVTFPLDHPLVADPAALSAWVGELALVRRGAFVSGTCGYAASHDDTAGGAEARREAERQLASQCRRYPGLDWRIPAASLSLLYRWDPALDDIRAQITRVSWLTILGEPIVRSLGGREALAAALAGAPDVEVRAAGAGAVVQAGAAPAIGDLGHRDFLPVYRRAAAALRSARMPEILGPSGAEEDWANEWLRAFDDGGLTRSSGALPPPKPPVDEGGS